jgi:hypothetical protein
MGTDNYNYARLVDKILETAVTLDNVNFAFQGNVMEINSMEITKYPVVVVSVIRPAIERENWFEFYLTLMYIDRLQEEDAQPGNPDQLVIESNGITALSRLVNIMRADPKIMDIPFGNKYTIYARTFAFSDVCQAVSTEITVLVPKDGIC